jgi:NADPH-dependent glutamate synthase beta subunit-like oxidoreductase
VVWAIRDGRDAAAQMHRYLLAKAAMSAVAVAAE